MSDAAPLHRALAAIGDAGIDIVPIVFERFFAAFPAERARFYNLDAAAARMTMETIEAMVGLAGGESWVATSITNFVDLHRNYGPIDAVVYTGFVDITVDTIIDLAGDHGNPAAWRTQAARMNAMIATDLGTADILRI